MTAAHGQVTLDGRPLRDVEVLRIDGTTPTALVRSDADGHYTLPEVAGDRIVLRVRTPIVGVWIAGVGTERVELRRSELVRVRLEFQVPEGVTFDWLDVKLTPRRDEVPPRVILATGVEPGLAEGMHGVRITEPHLELELRPGLYDLRAHRIVYDLPKGAPMTNLIADAVATDGPPAVPRFGGFEVELGQARELTVGLRLMKREEM